MMTHKQAEQKAREIIDEHMIFTDVKSLQKAITTALLDCQKAAVKEVCEVLEPFAHMADVEDAMALSGSVPVRERSTVIVKVEYCSNLKCKSPEQIKGRKGMKRSTIEALEKVTDGIQELLSLLNAEQGLRADYLKLGLLESCEKLKYALGKENTNPKSHE